MSHCPTLGFLFVRKHSTVHTEFTDRTIRNTFPHSVERIFLCKMQKRRRKAAPERAEPASSLRKLFSRYKVEKKIYGILYYINSQRRHQNRISHHHDGWKRRRHCCGMLWVHPIIWAVRAAWLSVPSSFHLEIMLFFSFLSLLPGQNLILRWLQIDSEFWAHGRVYLRANMWQKKRKEKEMQTRQLWLTYAMVHQNSLHYVVRFLN